jgi:hypothetical protein
VSKNDHSRGDVTTGYRETLVRRETGRKMRMREPYVEGVATHDDPESCTAARKGVGEEKG